LLLLNQYIISLINQYINYIHSSNLNLSGQAQHTFEGNSYEGGISRDILKKDHG